MRFFKVLFFSLAVSAPAFAVDFVLGVDRDDQEFFAYQAQLIAKAVELSDGDNSFEVVTFNLPAKRVLRDFETASTPFNLIIAGYKPAYERRYAQVYVPLTRGLLGTRLLAIPRGQQAAFDAVQSAEDLKSQMVFGSHKLWSDTQILEHAGFSVVSAEVDALWRMVSNGRLHAFPRAVGEIETEIKNYTLKTGKLDIEIEKGIAITYPFDYFAYMPRSSALLVDVLETGFQRAFETGEAQKIFAKYLADIQSVGSIRLQERRIIALENPSLSYRMRLIPEHYWYTISAPD